jgi:beta-glucanase (GH16 family)
MATASAPPINQDVGGTPAADSSWHLVFDDDFHESQLDGTKWTTSLPWGRENPPELEYYSDDAVRVDPGGPLRIEADKKDVAGHAYTSGVISSLGHYSVKYGFIEIRAKLPSGAGLWPAFWLLPQSLHEVPEVDIVENLGDAPNKLWLTQHWMEPNGKRMSAQKVYLGVDFSQAFHTYALDWEPSELVWYVDGVEQFRSDQGVPAEPMILIVNLSVGGWVGSPNAATVFPAYLDIDYVHVYQQADSGE